MSTLPVEDLKLRALEQRNRLHKTAEELRAKVEAGREHLRISNLTREHFLGASVFVSLLGLALGYSFAGVFTRH